MMKAKTTSEVINQFNRAFEQHDASLLTDLVAEECVMESVEALAYGKSGDTSVAAAVRSAAKS